MTSDAATSQGLAGEIGMDKASDAPSIGELIEQRLNRRDAMRGLLGAGAVATFSQIPVAMAQDSGPSTLTFKELAHTLDDQQHVAEGYDMQVVIRWVDPVVAGAPAFDPANLTAAAQEKQFGYNNDYLGLYALPAGSRSGDRFLMVANHEYTNANLMFAGLGAGRDGSFAYYIKEPIVDNDLKGVGPFILAGIEVQQLISGPWTNPKQ